MGRQRNDASSDDSSSDESYDNHSDHDHSSIEGSDDERSTVPGLQERNRVDSSSDDDRVPYVYNTDHNDSSFESNDDESSSSVSGLQHCSGCCSDEIPQSINTNSCAPPWTYDTVDEDDYDADHDDDAESIAPLRMRGGGTPVVETVPDDDTEEGVDD